MGSLRRLNKKLGNTMAWYAQQNMASMYRVLERNRAQRPYPQEQLTCRCHWLLISLYDRYAQLNMIGMHNWKWLASETCRLGLFLHSKLKNGTLGR